MIRQQYPFALSLSKGCLCSGTVAQSEGQGFDKLSPHGVGELQ